MESQMAHEHPHHYEEDPNNVGLHTVVKGEDEHQHEKSVLKKVKDKAKKIKDTLKLHGHGHGQHHEGHVPDDHDLDEEDHDDEEEMFEVPEIHGASGHSAPSTRSSVPGQEEDRGQLKVGSGRTNVMKEVPSAPINSPATVEQTKDNDPVKTFVHEQQAIRGQPEVGLEPTRLEEDPHAPKDKHGDYIPANYQTKVTDPTGAGGEEAEITPILHSLDKMTIHDAPKSGAKENVPTRIHDQFSFFPTGSHDQFSPEPTPPIPMTTQENPQSVPKTFDASNPQDQPRDSSAQEPSNQSSYKEKISSATSAIADKAISAKNSVASKLEYGDNKDKTKEHEVQEGHDNTKPASPVQYGKKIASTVTDKLIPVYAKVAGAGSTVMSKVHGTGTGNEEAKSRAKEQGKGMSMKDYFAEKLSPGEEDRALSQVISEVLSKRKAEEEKGDDDDKPVGKVTESEEVKRQLGSTDDEYARGRVDPSSVHIPGKGVVDKLKGAVASWLVKGEESRPSQQPLASSAGTGELSTTARGEETRERRLQESGN